MQIGDLVKSKSSGKIGIVTSHCHSGCMVKPHYHVAMHNNTYTIYANNLEPLEKK